MQIEKEQSLSWEQIHYIFQNYQHIQQKPKLFKIQEQTLLKNDLFNVEEHRLRMKQARQYAEQKQKMKQQQEHMEKVKNGQASLIPEKPKKPSEPDPDDCCGQGCAVCVWDIYYEQLDKYEEELQIWESKYGSVSTNNTDNFAESALEGKQRIMDLVNGNQGQQYSQQKYQYQDNDIFD